MGRAAISSERWHEEVFMRGGARWLAVISNDANDLMPCFYIKVWNITANRRIRDYSSFSEITMFGDQTDGLGHVLDSFIDPCEYYSDGVCYQTMATALMGLKELKRKLG